MTDPDLDPDAVEEANVAAAAGHAEHLLKHAIETHATVGPGNRAAAELLAVVLQSLSAIESPTRQQDEGPHRSAACVAPDDKAFADQNQTGRRPLLLRVDITPYFRAMLLSTEHITKLGRGTAYSFASWPNPSVPTFGAGVWVSRVSRLRVATMSFAPLLRLQQATAIPQGRVKRCITSGPNFEPLVLTESQQKDIERLHAEFRNNFVHFTPKGWSIEKEELPRIVGAATDAIEKLMSHDQLIRRMSRNQLRRLKTNLKQARAALQEGMS